MKIRNKRYKLDDKLIPISYNVIATVRDAKTGRVKRKIKYHNLVTTAGKTAIATNLADPTPNPSSIFVNYCAVGTDDTAANAADVTLGAELARNPISSNNVSGNVAYLTGFFAAAEAVGTIKEVGFFINGSSVEDSGTLLSRTVVNITKSGSETLTLDIQITIN